MIPQTLTNFNLALAGTSYAGKASQVQLPKLKRKTEAWRGGGMDGEIDLAVGLEKMEAGFTLTGIDKASLAMFGLADGSAFNGTFRGAFTDKKGKVVAAVCTLRGLLTEVDMGNWEAGKKNETKYALTADYYKLEVDGAVVYEIDPVGLVRIIDGVDELAAERAALGL
ncbi:phage major tail tube protein [Vogesella sp. GCM10023246]|uniref:Phage major tail tube protein n=1 Tax=Vogesella oryzagri TaxID=3160864 RepID=A0ABV1M2T8_9NEIS